VKDSERSSLTGQFGGSLEIGLNGKVTKGGRVFCMGKVAQFANRCRNVNSSKHAQTTDLPNSSHDSAADELVSELVALLPRPIE
jgi:hypothetical protein